MILDAHTHVFPPEFIARREALLAADPGFRALYAAPGARLATAEDLLGVMDESRVDRSVILGFPWRRAALFRRHNDYIASCVQARPHRFIGLGCFWPLARHAAQEAARCLAAGLAGIGELASYGDGRGRDLAAPLAEIMAVCRAGNAPVLLHAAEPVGHAYAGKEGLGPGEAYRIVKAFPANRIVLAHWGGGLVFYGLMTREVGAVMANVWFDTAATPYLYRPEIYRLAGEMVGHDRILFGSDYPLLRPERYLADMRAAGIGEEALKRVTGLNAAAVFGVAPL